MNHVMRVAVLLLAGASVLSAQSKWDGTWKLDLEKSGATGVTITYAAAADGAFKYDDGTTIYTFKTDGTEVDTQPGSKDKFMKVDDRHIHHTWTMNGQPDGTEELSLSEDGMTMTSDAQGAVASGEPWSRKVDFKRVGGSGKGFEGTWKEPERDG